MKYSLALIFLLTALLLTGCDTNDSENAQPYDLTVFDNAGAVDFTGTIWLRFEENEDRTDITGIRDLNRSDDNNFLPNEGPLSGFLVEGEYVSIQLYADVVDGGLSLFAQLDGDNPRKFSGSVSVISIAGETPGGTFVAERR